MSGTNIVTIGHVVEELERRAPLRRGVGRNPGELPGRVLPPLGVPEAVPAEAEERKLLYLDATCPLVSQGAP